MSNAARSTGGHAQSLWKEGCACRPYTSGETCVSHTMVGSMLQHLLQFCNPFLPEIIPAWQSAWAVWPSRRGVPMQRAMAWHRVPLMGPTRILLSPQADCTSTRLSIPLSHVTRTDPAPQRSAGRLGATQRSVSLHHSHTSARRSALHTPAPASRVLTALDCPEVLVREHGGGVCLLERAPCAYWREPCVPTGESPVCLLERAPCTYRGEPVYLLEKSPCAYWRGIIV